MRREAEMLLKQGRALLLIAEGQRQLPEDSKLLIEVFGFTPAEARMSAHLASGGSVTEYSNLRAMTLGSARQLAKHCLDRTGVHSQSQLVSLINGVQIARQKIGG
jgi:DNA-binding CsgD family transcriptional regulator